MGEIYAAKTNHITNPVGFDLNPLVFSWKVKGCRDRNRDMQGSVISKEQNLYRYLLRYGRGSS